MGLKPERSGNFTEVEAKALRDYATTVYSFTLNTEMNYNRSGNDWRMTPTYSITPNDDFCEKFNRFLDDEKNETRQMNYLSIDIETYSSEDIGNTGVYRYAESEDFEILLFGYSIDFGKVEVIDLSSGEALPGYIIKALTDPTVVKTAYNAAFERTCLSRYLNTQLNPDEWQCTMVRAAMAGLPLSLDMAGKALGLENGKMTEGRALIKLFSKPDRSGKKHNAVSDPDKWKTFIEYNRRDVEVENAVRKMTDVEVTDFERQLYAIDQNINDRGVKLDMTLVRNAIRMSDIYTGKLSAEAQKLTGMDNPNSVAQIKKWLLDVTGNEVTSLSKKTVPDIIAGSDNDTVNRLLAIRQEMGKTSVKKYEAMQSCVCRDDRVRGLLQFFGSHTGRWAGRLVQVQNLPQNHLKDLDYARRIVRDGDLVTLETLFGNVPDTLSQLIRTAFVAEEGKTFIVADFSAIEARVIAWLAGEQWRLDVFRTTGKIYEASAAKMYHCDPSEITKTDPRRQKGKIAELALGYGGGVGALQKMGGEKMGLSEGEMKEIVLNWRSQSPAIVGLWSSFEKSAAIAVHDTKTSYNGIRFGMCGTSMAVTLPSGRNLYYPNMRIADRLKFGKTAGTLVFDSQNQTTKKWGSEDTYGGKLTENIVQAIARDCLAVTITRLEEKGYPIVFHVHDEIIAEVPDDGTKTLDEVLEIFRTPISWAEGLPLKGDGYVTKYYLKD